jgi:hypothetical protein
MAKFKKGDPGGPGGARKGAGRKPDLLVREIKDLAQVYTSEALERLAYWMRSDNAKASVSASIALLDRGHGKPAQALEVDGDGEPIIFKVVNYGTKPAV